MGLNHYLVCPESRQALALGKLVEYDYDYSLIPPRFSGWIDQRTKGIIAPADLNQMIERFLLLNYRKAVRVVPSEDLDDLDPEGDWVYFDEYDELMNLPLDLDEMAREQGWK